MLTNILTSHCSWVYKLITGKESIKTYMFNLNFKSL